MEAGLETRWKLVYK